MDTEVGVEEVVVVMGVEEATEVEEVAMVTEVGEVEAEGQGERAGWTVGPDMGGVCCGCVLVSGWLLKWPGTCCFWDNRSAWDNIWL